MKNYPVVSFRIGKIKVFCIDPNIRSNEISNLLQTLSQSSKIAFCDLAPTLGISTLIRRIYESGCEVVSYKDHHKNHKYKSVKGHPDFAHVLEVDFRDRSSAPACASMINLGEFVAQGVHVVITHLDLDGFFSACLGSGLKYPGMVGDAEIFDGAPKGDMSLTKIGSMISYAFYLIPPYFSQDEEGYYCENSRVFQTVSEWISGKLSENDLRVFQEEIRVAKRDSFQCTDELVQGSYFVAGNIIYTDSLPAVESGKKVDWNRLNVILLKQYGCSIKLFASTGTGHFGKQVFLRVASAFRSSVDLRNFPQVNAHVSGKGSMPLEKFDDFARFWTENGYGVEV